MINNGLSSTTSGSNRSTKAARYFGCIITLQLCAISQVAEPMTSLYLECDQWRWPETCLWLPLSARHSHGLQLPSRSNSPNLLAFPFVALFEIDICTMILFSLKLESVVMVGQENWAIVCEIQFRQLDGQLAVVLWLCRLSLHDSLSVFSRISCGNGGMWIAK